MKRVAFMVVVLLCINLPQAGAINIKNCAFQTMDRTIWSAGEVKRTVTCMSRKFNVSVTTAHYVATRESGYDERAWNHSSGAAGVYQHLIRYWPARADAYPKWQRWLNIKKDHWYNPRINIMVAMKMVRGGGWGPWGI